MMDVMYLIRKNLNKNKKLNCKDAFDISHQYKIPIETIKDVALENDILIDSCELGQFGNLDSSDYCEHAHKYLNELIVNNQISCQDARAAAAGFGLKYIRGIIKQLNIELTNCELGFKLDSEKVK